LGLFGLGEVVARTCDQHQLAVLLFHVVVELRYRLCYLFSELLQLFEFGGSIGIDHQLQLPNGNLHAGSDSPTLPPIPRILNETHIHTQLPTLLNGNFRPK
jgi:hypothetical protein